MGNLPPFWKASVVIILLSAFLYLGYGQTIAQVNNLSTSLFTNYNKHTRPINDQTQNVSVDIQIILIALRDFDEVLGKLSTAMVIQLRWEDESLIWDPSTNNNINSITVSQDSVWKPLLALANPYNELKELGDKNWVTVTVESGGEIQWDPFAAFDTTCSIDTTYYPFDSQTCKLEMYTYGYTSSEVSINPLTTVLDLSFYEGHATWKIASTNVANTQRGSGSTNITILSVTIKLERLPEFVVLNLLLPILVLALLNPLVFLLPTDSGERIGYSITILLALSVFMTILGDYIPQNADPISMCAQMLMILYVCSSGIVLLIIISMKIYFISDTRSVNSCLCACVRFCSLQCFKSTKVHSDEYSSKKGHEQPAVNATIIGEEKDSVKQSGIEIIGWKDVSHAFDKFCIVLMYVVIGLVMTVYLNILRTG